MTTTTTTVWTLATACGTEDVEGRHHDDDEYGEGFDPVGVVGDGGARIAAEGHRDHRSDDRVDGEEQPRDDPGEVALAPPPDDVLEESSRRGVAGTELGERVPLQDGDATRDEERDPDRRAGNFTGGAEQREDPCSHHRADPDEGRLAHRQ
jgi:hypothetical protein